MSREGAWCKRSVYNPVRAVPSTTNVDRESRHHRYRPPSSAGANILKGSVESANKILTPAAFPPFSPYFPFPAKHRRPCPRFSILFFFSFSILRALCSLVALPSLLSLLLPPALPLFFLAHAFSHTHARAHTQARARTLSLSRARIYVHVYTHTQSRERDRYTRARAGARATRTPSFSPCCSVSLSFSPFIHPSIEHGRGVI